MNQLLLGVVENELTPLKLLQAVSAKLEPYRGNYCVAGGFAASFYRKQPRITNDVDIALCLGSYQESLAIAEKVVSSLRFRSTLGWIADSEKHLDKSAALLIGKPGRDEFESTIDFLLPSFPWLKSAVRRSQDNQIDYGFGRLPTITPEDLLLAKFFALSIEANRFQDMDDVQAILSANNQLDFIYLLQEFERLKLEVPKSLEGLLPKALVRLSKRNKN